MIDELKPCPTPWCAPRDSPYVWQGPDDKFFVICADCRVEGPARATAAEARAAWNSGATKPIINLRRQVCTVPEPHGDCWRACLATITGLDAAAMPNFVHASGVSCPDDATKLAREWLKPHGLTIFDTFLPGDWSLQTVLKDASAINPGAAFILSGQAAHTDDGHAVVALNGMIAHDPSGAGLSGPCRCACGKPECKMKIWGVWLIVPLVDDRPATSQEAEVRQAPTEPMHEISLPPELKGRDLIGEWKAKHVALPREVVEEVALTIDVFLTHEVDRYTLACDLTMAELTKLARGVIGLALARLKEATDGNL